jgi:ribosome-associated protein
LISRTLAKTIAQLMYSKKGFNVVSLDLRKLVSTTDYFVLCSADSDTQVKAIADAVRDGLEKTGVNIYHYEGYQASRWIVLDYVDVVAHVFHTQERSFYNLERLWGDAKRIDVEDAQSEPKKTALQHTIKRKRTQKKRVVKE